MKIQSFPSWDAFLIFSTVIAGFFVPDSLLDAQGTPAAAKANFSGIYPHLAFDNEEDECGTGALVPWAGRLWAITYGPHSPFGSSDRLYEITPDLTMTVRPESVGGTCANRMIHSESGQLFIGRYVIDRGRRIRVLSPERIQGRLTGCARSLDDPARKILLATMEEGIYEVDVVSLNIDEWWPDTNPKADGVSPDNATDDASETGSKEGRHFRHRPGAGDDILPGYHGKGFYSGQGRLVYANNGEDSPEARTRPDLPSGALGQWNGVDGGGRWNLVARNQFCDVTGPGGIWGNRDFAADPIWTVGWDVRSVILKVLDDGQWVTYRLPKASHCYDGAHGWNTEWPRIREIDPPQSPSEEGRGDAELAPPVADGPFLMTMHGMFWSFPRDFSASRSAGIRPLSSYLKVIGDFARWREFDGGRFVVFGCDDAARNEFLNKRRFKGETRSAGRSQSNLWFVEADRLDSFGPASGDGAVWLHDAVKKGETSDPFLFDGFDRRSLHLANDSGIDAAVALEVDRFGKGEWTTLKTVPLPAGEYRFVDFNATESAAWIRLVSDADLTDVTAMFHFGSDFPERDDSIFQEIAEPDDGDFSAGLVRNGLEEKDLHFVADRYEDGRPVSTAYYRLNAEMKLAKSENVAERERLRGELAVPTGLVTLEKNGVLIVDDRGRRYRLPLSIPFDGKGGTSSDAAAVPARLNREIVTERDLLNVAGTFFELPAENADGFARIRPIATHRRKIVDFCSHRGMMILTGVKNREEGGAETDSLNVIRSDDGKAALWAGTIDDLWRFGKPVGFGGPWRQTRVASGEVSDPYLIHGYDRKRLILTRHAMADSPDLPYSGSDGVTGNDRSDEEGEKGESAPIEIRLEVDFTGDGRFYPFQTFAVASDKNVRYDFPKNFAAFWVRLVAESPGTFTSEFLYE